MPRHGGSRLYEHLLISHICLVLPCLVLFCFVGEVSAVKVKRFPKVSEGFPRSLSRYSTVHDVRVRMKPTREWGIGEIIDDDALTSPHVFCVSRRFWHYGVQSEALVLVLVLVQYRTGQYRTVQGRTGQDRAVLVRTRTGQIRSGQVRRHVTTMYVPTT